MMNKKTMIVILLLVLMILISGCSKKDDGVLTIAFDIEDKDRYDDFFAQFESLNPDIDIQAIYGQDIAKLIGTDEEPDLFKTGDAYIEGISRSYLPLDDMIASDDEIDLSDYHANIIDSLRVDGKLYALPTSINTSLLYYNKTLFDESAESLREALELRDDESVYPRSDWTYDEFVKAGVVLTKYSGSGVERTYTQFGAETQSTWWGEWLIYVRHLGGDFYADENNRRSALDSSAALEGTRFMYDKSMGDDDEKFAPSIFDPELSFAGGTVAMIFGGHMGDWLSYNKLGLDWDIEVLPTPPGRSDASGGEISTDAFGISARTRIPDKAFRFLKYWVSEEGAKAMYSQGKIGALKAMPEIARTFDQEERGRPYNIDAVFEAMKIAMPLPREKDFERVSRQYVMNQIQIMLSGSQTPEKAMTNAHRAVNTYYENLYGDD